MPINLNFSEALEALGADAAFRIANAARPPAVYLFGTLLPEVTRASYTASAGSMVVRTTMAGLAAMDSPYPPGGVMDVSRFIAEVAKIANEVSLPERSLRELQTLLQTLGDQATVETVQNEALNFLQKVIIQAHLDTMEWLRGQALTTGALAWTFNNLALSVDYGVPDGNFLTKRTGNDAWDGSASKFWTDIRLLQKALRYNVRAYIMHPDTLNAIVNNDANKIEVLSQTDSVMRIRRLVGDNERPASDARETVELIAYGLEAEVLDPAKAGEAKIVPFMPSGKILAVGNNNQAGYRVGEGSTPDPTMETAWATLTWLPPSRAADGLDAGPSCTCPSARR
jgi:hypothetical protein